VQAEHIGLNFVQATVLLQYSHFSMLLRCVALACAQVFTVWRLLARRAALQKQAMLGRIAGRAHGSSSGRVAVGRSEALPLAPGPSPSQLRTLQQALAATRSAFQSVKDYVGTAGQELQQLRASSQLSRCWQLQHEEEQQAQQEHAPPPGSPGPSSPAPVGSLQALLALLQPPPAGQGPECSAAPAPAPSQLPRLAGREGLSVRVQGGSAPAYSAAGESSPPPPRSPDWWSGIDAGSPRSGSPWQGSSPACSPSYNPARYASPTKLPSVHHPEAIQAELEGHLAAMMHIRQELEDFEKVKAAAL
jgi:hypothetical protein